MTGYRSSFFRHNCVADGCYIDGLPCWDDLIEAFPRKIRPTDVDGMVEINNHFLFLEEKQRGVAPEEGQRKALLALSTWPNHTVLFVRPGSASECECLMYAAGKASGWTACSRADLMWWLRSWARDADAASAQRSVS